MYFFIRQYIGLGKLKKSNKHEWCDKTTHVFCASEYIISFVPESMKLKHLCYPLNILNLWEKLSSLSNIKCPVEILIKIMFGDQKADHKYQPKEKKHPKQKDKTNLSIE